ncbi:MAG: TRAP transporter substrate-binding protein DctP [Proteobacteria bacterium]|nr:TRAP transporter substrate-binding protein DctP [Pseudomonadota bacterium]
MNTRSVIKFIGLLLLACLFFTGPVQGAEKGVIIKLATLAPQGNSWVKMLHALNAEVMKKTENNVQLKIYAGGVLGDENDMLRKMKIGQIQAAALTSTSLSSIFKEINVLQIPFLFQNYDEVDLILKKMDTFLKKGFEDNGYILLGFSEVGFVYLMSSTIPISSVADIKKGKVWIQEESHMAKAVFDAAKVTAIPLSIPDVLVGLQTGLVDVVYIPPTGAISLQWFTKMKYLTNVPLAYVAGAIVISKDVFNRLPPAYQAILLESSQRHLSQLKATTRNENKEATRIMVKQGVKIVTPSKDQIDELRKLSNDAMGRISGKAFSRTTVDDVTSQLTNYRKGLK